MLTSRRELILYIAIRVSVVVICSTTVYDILCGHVTGGYITVALLTAAVVFQIVEGAREIISSRADK